jgi:hypothetical protein
MSALPSSSDPTETLRALLEEQIRQGQDLQAILKLLQERGPLREVRLVRVQGDVSNSVIVLGDDNLVLHDGGWLARSWEEENLSEEAAAQRYLEQAAQFYGRLRFPLAAGFSFDLSALYVPLPVLSPGGETLTPADGWFVSSRPRALLGGLGQGKSTTLQHLTWVYAARSGYFYPREGELLPFYLPARRLAQFWTAERDLLSALAQAAARPYGRLDFNPRLLSRLLRRALEEGRAFILLDALDEYRAQESERLNFFRSLAAEWETEPFRRNPLLVSSRPYRFLHLFESFSLHRQPDLRRLAFQLAKALWADSPLTEAELENRLERLEQALEMLHPLATPFYVTLFVLLACRAGDFEENLRVLTTLRRRAALLEYFLHKTIEWERTKEAAPSLDDSQALEALSLAAWRTFASPVEQEQVSFAPSVEAAESAQALAFWQQTGLLEQDDFGGGLHFPFAAFQAYGVARFLYLARRQGQEEAVRRLRQHLGQHPDWEEIWPLLDGLEGRAYARQPA